MAKRVSAAMRGGDTLARFGGDEFTILAEGLATPDDGAHIAERVSNTFEHRSSLAGARPS